MGYIINEYSSLEKAKCDAKEYDYALLYYSDGIRMIPAGKLLEDDWDGCMEARAFKKTGEIHFLFDGEMKAIKVSDSGSDDMITKEYYLAGKFCIDGKKIVRVKEYLGSDEDGQSRIILTRISELI